MSNPYHVCIDWRLLLAIPFTLFIPILWTLVPFSWRRRKDGTPNATWAPYFFFVMCAGNTANVVAWWGHYFGAWSAPWALFA
jgi:hypothetical protein